MKPANFWFFFFFICQISIGQPTQILYLSGTDKDHTKTWDFFCTEGRNSGKWTTIEVPSCWEQQGFGEYDYGGIKNSNKHKEEGLYRYTFQIPNNWKGKYIEIVFEGSMTDTEVKLNGKLAGPVHRGAFYRFGYDISSLLKFGKTNLLEVKVSKMSSDSSVNDAERSADYWVFGGIFRPVYLQCKAREHIQNTALDAKADGTLLAHVRVQKQNFLQELEAQVQNLAGEAIGSPFSTQIPPNQEIGILATKIFPIQSWSPESPNLYRIELRLKKQGKISHVTWEKFGFRTFEVRPRQGLFLNGRKIILKGICRHSFWPETGRTTSKDISILDVNLMKDMNMNAVRMSHYPPDVDFLDVCDSLGLLVLDELAGWQDAYSDVAGRPLIREMVIRDVNHPSIIFWDNGNEGGWNFNLDEDFELYDPQKRQVLHPWEKFRSIDCQHYRSYGYGTNDFFNGNDLILPTEFLHGLYDGGLGAGLEDYWQLLSGNPLGAGGFLWVFSDEGIVRTDKNGWIDTQKSAAPDGVVGPYREKEGSFYTIKEIWSPVHFPMKVLPQQFDGSFEVENRYVFTRLDQCKFEWNLYKYSWPFHKMAEIRSGVPEIQPVNPGQKGRLHCTLPENWQSFHALSLRVWDPSGREIIPRSWPITSPDKFSQSITNNQETYSQNLIEILDSTVLLKSKNAEFILSRKTGLLRGIRRNEAVFPLTNGPRLLDAQVEFDTLTCFRQNFDYVVDCSFRGKNTYNLRYTLLPEGWLKIDLSWHQRGNFDNLGVTFNFPDSIVNQVDLLAAGPYRVWKNRIKGPQFGLWHKKYNTTVTGESWIYPEFKGYYKDFYGMDLITKTGTLTVLSGSEQLFLHLFSPEAPKGAKNNNTAPLFPSGDISFLYGISAIGDKFTEASNLTPQGLKNQYFPNSPFMIKKCTLYLHLDKATSP